MGKYGTIIKPSVIRARHGMVCTDCGKEIEVGGPAVKIGRDTVVHYHGCAEQRGYRGLDIPWKKAVPVNPLKASKQAAGGMKKR